MKASITRAALVLTAGVTSVALASPAVAASTPDAESSTAAGLTSSFVAYPGTSFTGTPQDINGCGVHNLPLPVQSYRWFGRGQDGRMYNGRDGNNYSGTTLASNLNADQSTPVGWQSIIIIC